MVLFIFALVDVSSSRWAAPSSLAVVGSHCWFAFFSVPNCVQTDYWPICAYILPLVRQTPPVYLRFGPGFYRPFACSLSCLSVDSVMLGVFVLGVSLGVATMLP